MVLSETITVTVNSKTFKRYKELGYDFEKVGDEIEIYYQHLAKFSEELLEVKCDYCGKIFQRKYADHYRILHSKNNYINNKDCCYGCKNLKQEEISLKKFGVKNSFELPEVREKCAKTIFEKYGVKNVSQSGDIQEKIRMNNLRKYGVTSTSKLEEIKQKVRDTNLERYGTPYLLGTQEFIQNTEALSMERYGTRYPCMSEEIKEKIRQTNLKRYGCDNPLGSDVIKEKIARTKYINGTQNSSKQQNYFCNILGGELNYPFRHYYIDIAFPNEKIAVEYNGGGHNLSVKLGTITEAKFIQLETYRKKQLYADGWKIITFISAKNKILTEDEALLFYNYALSTFESGRHWIEIHIDERKIVNSQIELNFTQITMND